MSRQQFSYTRVDGNDCCISTWGPVGHSGNPSKLTTLPLTLYYFIPKEEQVAIPTIPSTPSETPPCSYKLAEIKAAYMYVYIDNTHESCGG